MREDTEDVLFYKQPKPFSCNICGVIDDINSYDTECHLFQYMKQRHICHSCAYWLDIIENPPLNMEVINGGVYIANPFVHRPLQVIKGNFGKEFYILKDDMKINRVNNLWKLGDVPERFLEYFQDTAHFLSLMSYQKICKSNHRCYAKGCWDRYQCVRYNMEAEKDGPFNVIPTNYQVGGECCPSFININEMKK